MYVFTIFNWFEHWGSPWSGFWDGEKANQYQFKDSIDVERIYTVLLFNTRLVTRVYSTAKRCPIELAIFSCLHRLNHQQVDSVLLLDKPVFIECSIL